MAKDRILGFDLARVVAIFLVIGVYHNLGYAGARLFTDASILSLVYSALGVFTFLSAFILSSKYSFYDKKDILFFYKQRFLRIWPLFAISSFLLFLVHFNELLPTLKGLVGISPFWAPAPTTMWYVAMLISLYLLTPFVIRGDFKRQIINGVIVMAAVGTTQLIFDSVVPKTFNYYFVFLIGLLTGKNYSKTTLSFLSSKKTMVFVLVWLLLFIIVCYTSNNWFKSITGVIGIVVLLNICLLFSEALASKQWFIGVTTVLSYSSFCAYLFHREIIGVLLHLIPIDSGLPTFCLVLLIGVPLTFLFAYLIQHMYDSVLHRLINQ